MSISIKEIAAPVGGVVALSTLLGLSRGAVSQWDQVPLERVPEVAKLTGYSREQLRPDYFCLPAGCDCNKSQEAA